MYVCGVSFSLVEEAGKIASVRGLGDVTTTLRAAQAAIQAHAHALAVNLSGGDDVGAVVELGAFVG
jgi:hypothetical protein